MLRCLGPQISPSVNSVLPPNFLVDALGKMITGAEKILHHHWEEALLDSLNQVRNMLHPLQISEECVCVSGWVGASVYVWGHEYLHICSQPKFTVDIFLSGVPGSHPILPDCAWASGTFLSHGWRATKASSALQLHHHLFLPLTTSSGQSRMHVSYIDIHPDESIIIAC